MFLRLLDSEAPFADEGEIRAWLIVTARNVCRDELRRARRRDVPLDDAQTCAAPPPEIDETLALVRSLPLRYRTPIYLFYYEGYSTAAPVSPSDQEYLQRALGIFRKAGLSVDGVESMTAIRQKNLYWDREEVEVLFDQGDMKCSVKFDAQDGVFIGMSGIDWVLDDAQSCQTDAEAEALARSYYEALPVAQGYVLQGVEKYDEQFYSYDFCREVAPELYSSYECIRISINPVSGRLTGCTVFYVPLLDDHEPGDQPLSQAEAEAAAQACTEITLDGYVLRSAEQTVCLPNWNYTGREAVNAKASSVTRLCWYLKYERPDSEFADKICLMVDLYTGEILGGDATR